MAKMRVHELAKELDKNNKDILDVLQANGVNVQSPLSVIDEGQADMVRRAYAPPAPPRRSPRSRPLPKRESRPCSVPRTAPRPERGRAAPAPQA